MRVWRAWLTPLRVVAMGIVVLAGCVPHGAPAGEADLGSLVGPFVFDSLGSDATPATVWLAADSATLTHNYIT